MQKYLTTMYLKTGIVGDIALNTVFFYILGLDTRKPYFVACKQQKHGQPPRTDQSVCYLRSRK